MENGHLINRIVNIEETQIFETGEYVLYWMNQSRRYEYNYSLNAAILTANKYQLPLQIIYLMKKDETNENVRHKLFLAEGIIELEEYFRKNRYNFHVYEYENYIISSICANAAAVFTDFPYLKETRKSVQQFKQNSSKPVILIDSDTVIPCKIVSQKAEYNAATFRKKAAKHLYNFLLVPEKIELKNKTKVSLEFPNKKIQMNLYYLKLLEIKQSFSPEYQHKFQGGYSNAKIQLKKFLTEKISKYAELRNDPSLDYSSNLSAYLHFGFISPVEIAMKVLSLKNSQYEKYLDELIIRRELSINFTVYDENYDSLRCLPSWAEKTLNDNLIFDREYSYTLAEFENYATHDIYWNSAQKEMIVTGKMQAYMRMYWGKKIIEWSKTPYSAYSTMVYLNNKYSLDGSDSNSYDGIAWCFGKHDRAFKERKIFGKVRYMNEKGLKRKFYIDEYVKMINNL